MVFLTQHGKVKVNQISEFQFLGIYNTNQLLSLNLFCFLFLFQVRLLLIYNKDEHRKWMMSPISLWLLF